MTVHAQELDPTTFTLHRKLKDLHRHFPDLHFTALLLDITGDLDLDDLTDTALLDRIDAYASERGIIL